MPSNFDEKFGAKSFKNCVTTNDNLSFAYYYSRAKEQGKLGNISRDDLSKLSLEYYAQLGFNVSSSGRPSGKFAIGSDGEYKHIYRELYIYYMIELFDNEYRTAYEQQSADMAIDAADEDTVETRQGATAVSDPLTVDQKRFFRDDICNRINTFVRDYNGSLFLAKAKGQRLDESYKSVYDEDVIVDAFFHSHLGNVYKGYTVGDFYESEIVRNWRDPDSPDRKRVNDISRSWSIDNMSVFNEGVSDDAYNSRKYTIAISPYDPNFSVNYNFLNNGSLGLFVSDSPAHFKRLYLGNSAGKSEFDAPIRKVIPSNHEAFFNQNNGPYALTAIDSSEMRDRTVNAIAGTLQQEKFGDILSDTGIQNERKNPKLMTVVNNSYNGMAYIDAFIKNKSTRYALVNYFRNINKRSFPDYMTSEDVTKQYLFMHDVCEYLDEKGIGFDIVVNERYNSLQIKLDDSNVTIGLLDPANPRHRGKIYDGREYYLSLRNASYLHFYDEASQEISADEYYDRYLDNDLCLNMVKYYFGESIGIDDEVNVNNTHHVGEAYAYDRRNDYGLSVTTDPTNGGTLSRVLLARKLRPGQNPGTTLPMNIMMSVTCAKDSNWSASYYARIVSATNSSLYRNFPKRISSSNDRIKYDYQMAIMANSVLIKGQTDYEDIDPLLYKSILLKSDIVTSEAEAKKAYPGYNSKNAKFNSDTKSFSFDVSDGSGVVSTYTGYMFRDGMSAEHEAYYNRTKYANMINNMIISAKNNHREFMDLDSMFDAFRSLPDGVEKPEYEGYSIDKSVKLLQEEIWNDILTSNDESFSKMSVEDRIDRAKAYYEAWSDSVIGQCIAIPVPDDAELAFPDPAFSTEHSFSPDYVAKYAGGSYGNGLARNIGVISYLCRGLGDDYKESIFKTNKIYDYDTYRSSLMNSKDAEDVADTDVAVIDDNNEDVNDAFDDSDIDDYGDTSTYDDNAESDNDSTVFSYARQLRNDLREFDESTSINFDMSDLCEKCRGANGRLDYDALRNRLFAYESGKGVLPGFEDKPFTGRMVALTARTLFESGARPLSVRIGVDDNGLLEYKALFPTEYSMDKGEDVKLDNVCKERVGYIGQILEPGAEFGELDIDKIRGNGQIIIPGYDGYYKAFDRGAEGDYAFRNDRLRAYGYESRMRNALIHDIRESVFSYETEAMFVSSNTSLNRVYKQLISSRHNKAEFYADIAEVNREDAILRNADGKEYFDERYYNDLLTNRELKVARYRTEAKAIRMPTDLIATNGSNISSFLRAPNTDAARRGMDIQSFNRNGGNVRILDEEITGGSSLVDDPDDISYTKVCFVTTGSASKAGIKIFGTKNAEFDPVTNEIKAAPNTNDVSELLESDISKDTVECDPCDRIIMAVNNMFDCKHVLHKAHVYLMTSNGGNFDDGIVVSKSFVERYPYVPIRKNNVTFAGDKNASHGLCFKPLDTNDPYYGKTEKDCFGGRPVYRDKFNRVIFERDGEYFRCLDIQDKLSDKHGDKGTITRVVDADMCSKAIAADLTSRNPSNITIYERVKSADSTWVNRKVNLDSLVPGGNYKIKFKDGSLFDFVLSDNKSSVRDAKQLRQAKIDDVIKAIQKQYNVYDDEATFFYDNADAEVLMAPQALLSRQNSGTYSELLGDDLDGNGNAKKHMAVYVDSDGNEQKVVGGELDLLLLDKSGDDKSHANGRKWGIMDSEVLVCSKSKKLLERIYGSDVRSINEFRMYMMGIGLDCNEKLQPMFGYHRQAGENARLLTLPSVDDIELGIFEKKSAKSSRSSRSASIDAESENNDVSESVKSAKDPIDNRKSSRFLNNFKKSFDNQLKKGGFLELPFSLDFKIIEKAFGSYDNFKKMYSRELTEAEEEGRSVQFDTNTIEVPGSVEKYGSPRYALPILPYSVRHDCILNDGFVSVSDFTRAYHNICENACLYMYFEKKVKDIEDSRDLKKYPNNAAGNQAWVEYLRNDPDHIKYQLAMEKAKESAQSNLDSIVDDIVDHKFASKKNLVRDSLMAKRIEKSGTFNCGSDARIGINDVAMSSMTAKSLGLMNKSGKLIMGDDTYAVVSRAPILNTGNIRYMHVVIDETINNGIKINCVSGKSFDGDYDGDTYGVYNFMKANYDKLDKNSHVYKEDMAIHDELKHTLSHRENLLDYGVNPDEKGEYPLYFNFTLDCVVNMAKHPELKARYDALVTEVNKSYAEMKAVTDSGRVDSFEFTIDGHKYSGQEAIDKKKDYLTDKVSDFARDSLSGVGLASVDCSDVESVLLSLQDYYKTGAKGDSKKLMAGAGNMGVTYETEPDPDIDGDVCIVEGSVSKGSPVRLDPERRTEATARDNENKQTAAFRADKTADGGTCHQAFMMRFINKDAKVVEASEVISYPVTQAYLQAKKGDNAQAIDNIATVYRESLFNGKLISNMSGEYTTDDFRAAVHRLVCVQYESDAAKLAASEGRMCEDFRKKQHTTVFMQCKTRNDTTYMQSKEFYDGSVKPVAVNVTREEFIESMKNYCVGCDVDVNLDSIVTLADAITDKDGIIEGIYDGIDRDGSLAYKMSYAHADKFSTLVKECVNSSLYDDLSHTRAVFDGLNLEGLDPKSEEYAAIVGNMYSEDDQFNLVMFVPTSVRENAAASNTGGEVRSIAPASFNVSDKEYEKLKESSCIDILGGFVPHASSDGRNSTESVSQNSHFDLNFDVVRDDSSSKSRKGNSRAGQGQSTVVDRSIID